MTQTAQELDNLTLSLIKEHLYVDIVEDDTLITSYADASLELTQKYLNSSVLETTYTNTANELIKIDNYLYLTLNYKPYALTITSDILLPDNILDNTYNYGVSENLVNTITVEKEFYNFLNGKLYINVENIVNYDSTAVLSVEAKTGHNPVKKTTNQARLLIIAGWYANRESVTNLSTNKIPFNAELLLGLDEESFI